VLKNVSLLKSLQNVIFNAVLICLHGKQIMRPQLHIIDDKKMSSYHYKTINKIHIKWSKNKNNECNVIENLYIDGTLIINKHGINDVEYGCGESKKIFSFVTIIYNENIKPICFFSNDVNTKTICTQ